LSPAYSVRELLRLRHILLIQNDEPAAQTITRALTESADSSVVVEWVRSCSAALERLTREPAPCGIDAVLLDLCLADSQGIETFDQVFRAVPRIPILILSTAANEGLAKLAVQRGAQDYLLQARLDAYLLPKTLNSMIERAANTDARVA
jgi:CheY-like chemotaxis protein